LNLLTKKSSFINLPKFDGSSESSALLEGGRFVLNSIALSSRFKSKNLLCSFSFAFEGLAYAFKTQRNFRIHLVLAAIALTTASFLAFSILEWAILWGLIGVVLFAELMNTALELCVDLLTQGRYDERAKAIKDISAGAVLITALTAAICGVSIFIPHLVARFTPLWI
jgi:diacylglycerol kinase (ATP)